MKKTEIKKTALRLAADAVDAIGYRLDELCEGMTDEDRKAVAEALNDVWHKLYCQSK